MSRNDIANRAAKLGERKGGRAAVAETEEAFTPRPPSAPRAKPIRVTTDLAPQSYRALVSYCQDVAENLGRAKVPHVEVIRALVAELETDPVLRATIEEAVRKRLSN